MIFNASELNELPKADICIVGTGPSGLSIALKLEKTGLTVLLIEAGNLDPSPESQSLYSGDSVGIQYPLSASRMRALGGSSNCWGGWCRQLENIEFSKRDWLANSSWPISQEELASYYKEAGAFLNIEGTNFNALDFAKKTGKPSLSICEKSSIMEPIVWQISSNTRLGKDYYTHLNESKKITLVYNCCANKLNYEKDKIVSVNCLATSGKNFNAISESYVIALGALENARLLLDSELGENIGGPWVGKGFMEHPARINGFRVYVPNEYPAFMEEGGGKMADVPNEKFKIAFGFKLSDKAQVENNIMGLWGVFSDPITNLPEAELAQAKYLLDSSNSGTVSSGVKAYDVTWAIEQAPTKQSCLTLDKISDASGMRKIKLDWKITDLDVKTANKAQQLIAGDFIERGIGRFRMVSDP
ncbi:FAD-dependent oxidoreductase [Pseudomonas sp. LT1P18]|uniref:FAD-dependent oxidoreductase n=1 Tax=Pseudomonas arabinosi TaxID=3398357 RepID=UPI0039EF81C8